MSTDAQRERAARGLHRAMSGLAYDGKPWEDLADEERDRVRALLSEAERPRESPSDPLGVMARIREVCFEYGEGNIASTAALSMISDIVREPGSHPIGRGGEKRSGERRTWLSGTFANRPGHMHAGTVQRSGSDRRGQEGRDDAT